MIKLRDSLLFQQSLFLSERDRGKKSILNIFISFFLFCEKIHIIFTILTQTVRPILWKYATHVCVLVHPKNYLGIVCFSSTVCQSGAWRG